MNKIRKVKFKHDFNENAKFNSVPTLKMNAKVAIHSVVRNIYLNLHFKV